MKDYRSERELFNRVGIVDGIMLDTSSVPMTAIPHDRGVNVQSEMQKEIDKLKVENEMLRENRNCGQWIAIKHPYTNSHGTCEIEDEFRCPFCNVASNSRTHFCSHCGSYLRGVIDEQV